MMRSYLLLMMIAAALPSLASSTLTVASNDIPMEPEVTDEFDEESDSAPFAIVVEQGDGRRCSGSLLSLRTALTSAWCARPQPQHEVWALAPAAPPAPAPARAAHRRVARVAVARGADTDVPRAWLGIALDIAVLELEMPFGSALSRPILIATRSEECVVGATCHVVRPLGRTLQLFIVDVELVDGEVCASRAPGWAAIRDTALCLTGPTLCSSDRGAGVVCAGKLCGVVSGSTRSDTSLHVNITTDEHDASPGINAADDTCGDTHVAQSVARWTRFLHCAHTLRACGSEGECAELCSEVQLIDEELQATIIPTVTVMPKTAPALIQVDRSTLGKTRKTHRPLPSVTHTLVSYYNDKGADVSPPHLVTRTASGKRVAVGSPPRMFPTRSPASPLPAALPALRSPQLHSFEFEPNRADFRAGEYGDNVAQYGDEEGAGGGASRGPLPSSAADTTPTDRTHVPLARYSQLAARVGADGRTRDSAPGAAAPRSTPALYSLRSLIPFIYTYIYIL